MMSFCKKSVHSFLGFTNSKDNETLLNLPHRNSSTTTITTASANGGAGLFTISTQKPTNLVVSETALNLSHRNSTTSTTTTTASATATGGVGLYTISSNTQKPTNLAESETTPNLHHRNSTSGGVGLFTISTTMQKPTNVVESSSIKSFPTTPSSVTTTTTTTFDNTGFASDIKKDPGGIGFIDEVGGSVDGLMSCTESLGFESSDERRVDDHIDNLEFLDHGKDHILSSNYKFVLRKTQTKIERKKFPPPITTLNHDGRPSFYLSPCRKDGRLELVGVKVGHRPEILRASREDGRLRLHLIRDDEEEDEDDEIQEEEEEQEEEDDDEVEIDEQEVMVGEKEKVERWQFPVVSGGSGEGLRRCNELASHHNHHHHHHHRDLNVWRQHCLTIR